MYPETETINIDVVLHLSSTPFIRTVVDPFKQNVHLFGDTC